MSEPAEATGPAFWGGADDTEALQRYQALVNAIDDGLYQLDNEGRFVAVNDGIVEMTGYAPGDLVGEHVSVLLENGSSSAVEREIERLREDSADRSGRLECTVRTAGGEDVRCDVRMNSLEANGTVQGTVGVVREVTGRDADGRDERGDDEEQRPARERLIAALETAREGISLLDDDGHFVYVNDAYAETFGYAPGEMVGEHWEDLGIEADPDTFHDEILPSIAEEGQWTGTTTCVRSDGSTFLGQHSLTHTEDEELICVVRDATEQKRAQQRLEEERDMFAQGPTVVFRWNPDAGEGWPVEYVSENVEDVLGYTPEELESEAILYSDLLLDEEIDRITREIEEARDGETERFSHDPYRIRTKDGDVRWVKDVTKIVRDERGEITNYLGYLVDITERKERERALRESERRYRALVEHFPNGAVALVDDDLRYQTVGGNPTDVADVTADEIVGRPVREAVPAELADELVPCYEDALDGESSAFEAELENGVFEFQVVPIRDQDDEVFAALGMSQDVTDRKEREQELRRKERRFEAVFEDPNILVGLLDPDGTVLDINETAMEYIDSDLDDVTGEPFWETPWWGAEDGIQEDVKRWTERAAAGEYVDFEADLTKPGGQRYVLEGFFRPVTNDEGEVVSVIVSDRDVTEQREYERQLEESERRYRALAENFPNGIVTLFDHDLEYTLAAGQGFDRIAIDPDDVEGHNLRTVWDDSTVDALEPLFEDALDGEAQSVEVTYAGRDWVVHVVPITDEQGNVFAGMTMAQDITERKERERELAKYETIVETMNDGIYVKDQGGYFTMVNEAYAELTGYDREELLGEHASLVVDEETIEQARERQAETTTDDSANSTMEAMIQRADGDKVPTEGTFSTLQTGGGEENEVGVVRDITERKEQRRRIEESERRYRTIVENFPNGAVAMFDENLEYTVAGGDILDDIGTTGDEIVGQTVWDRYPEELAAQLEPDFRAAIDDGEANEFEIEFDGRHWAAYTLPVRDSDGDVFAGMMMVQDVTERIQREQALEESKNQLQALIELLPVAVFVAEADGQIVEWNEAAEEIWGGEVVESDSVAEYAEYDGWWADTGEPVEPDEWALARALRGEEVTDPDVIEIEGFDGKRRTVLNHGMPVRDADGEVSRAVVTLIDITERNEYQRKLEASNERLEQFAYAASHDLQEPLRMVSSYLRLIEQRYADQLDEDGRDFIDFAVDGADRMRDMIEGLLKYSRVDTQGDPFEPVDLDAVLDDVREDLQVTIEESGADVTASSLPRVTGDEGQLRQLFQNLIDNAIEYSGDDDPRVRVDAERAGSKWRLSVSDEGIGIDPGDLDRVFEVFQSLHAPDEYSGTGIGLALCERIVERHGGEIWVESEPGEGSTFTFTLPADGEYDE